MAHNSRNGLSDVLREFEEKLPGTLQSHAFMEPSSQTNDCLSDILSARELNKQSNLNGLMRGSSR